MNLGTNVFGRRILDPFFRNYYLCNRMKTISLQVDDQLANRLNSMNQGQIDHLMSMLKKVLEDNRSIEEIILEAQKQANVNGLTEKKLNQILRELDK